MRFFKKKKNMLKSGHFGFWETDENSSKLSVDPENTRVEPKFKSLSRILTEIYAIIGNRIMAVI